MLGAQTVKAKKSGGSSDDGSYRDVSPHDTLTRSTSGTTTDSNKYRANARAKLPSLFNPFGKVTFKNPLLPVQSGEK